MKVIAFTGMPGSGKSVAVNVAKELDIPVIRMGDVVWEEVRNRGMKINDENVGKVADEMRKKEGMDIWAQETLETMDPDIEKVVIDGLRNREEVELFKEKLGGDFSLIAIHASPETRHRRLLERKRDDDSVSIERIKKRDKRELSWGIGVLIALADSIIVNEGPLDDFRKRIKRVLQSL